MSALFILKQRRLLISRMWGGEVEEERVGKVAGEVQSTG
jgi:hypothetical protein